MVVQFKDRKFDETRLIAFGFKKLQKGFYYSTEIVGSQFKMEIFLNRNFTKTKVVETASNCVYDLHLVLGASGRLVESVRREYNAVLEKIAGDCFVFDAFKSSQTNAVIKYAALKFGEHPEYLWPKFPRIAVLRRRDNSKWFAVIFAIPQKKLGLKGDGDTEIIDIRAEPSQIPALIDGKSFFGGYHMGKKNWIAARLDGSLPIRSVYKMLLHSRQIAGEESVKNCHSKKSAIDK